MKKHYVVIMSTGYYEAPNKKDALETQNENPGSYIIHTRSTEGNYYHNRIKIIAVSIQLM